MREDEIINILDKAYFGAAPDEISELRALPTYISGQTHFVDIGASLGQYTKALNEICEGVTITCVEPDPVRFKQLEKNCALWAANGKNKIIPLWGVVADRAGKSSFFVTDSNISGSLNAIKKRSDHWREIEVPSYRLDDLVETSDNNFVKVDVEGGEFSVLGGASAVLNGNNNVLLIELHVWGGGGKFPDHVLLKLRDDGYTFERACNHYLFKKATGGLALSMLTEAAAYRLRRYLRYAKHFAKAFIGSTP